MITLIFSFIISLSCNALDVETVITPHAEDLQKADPFPHKAEVQKKMQDISDKLASGRIPSPGEDTEFYSGLCLTSYSSVEKPQVYSAKVALRTSPTEGLQIAYTTTQGGSYTPLTAKDLSSLQKQFEPKTKSYVVMTSEEGEYAQFKMAEASASLPEIYSALSVDKNDPDQMAFVAIFMGYYCELTRVK